jgi:HemK-like putative methylase
MSPAHEATFSGVRLLTAPSRVMTPRSTTEPLVERALAWIGSAPATVADVGSGSGAIAIAIALRASNAEVWAVDSNADAVELTRANVLHYDLGGRVHVVRGDLLDGVPARLDIVAANLPYLPERLAGEPEYADLLGEPMDAVFASGDGLGPYRRLLAASQRRLTERGALLIQYRGRIFEAERSLLSSLLTELEQQALAA